MLIGGVESAIVQRVQYLISDAVKQGAKPLCGGEARGIEVARRIVSGTCHINGPTVHDQAQMPFGGVKASGYGRFGGRAGTDAFTELRWITLQTTPRHYPF